MHQTQLDLLPIVVYEPDPLPVVIVILVNHDVRCATDGRRPLLAYYGRPRCASVLSAGWPGAAGPGAGQGRDTSVPCPGADRIDACPPHSAVRFLMDRHRPSHARSTERQYSPRHVPGGDPGLPGSRVCRHVGRGLAHGVRDRPDDRAASPMSSALK